MNKDRESKIKKRKVSCKKERVDKKKFDTLSITMELEKPLSMEEKTQKTKRTKKQKKIILLVTLIVLFCSVVSFCFWINNTYKLSEEGKLKIKNNNIDIAKMDDNIVFMPKDYDKKVGIIFYPAERVEEDAYAGLCKKLSQSGYKVVVPKMNFNLPFLSTNKADEVISQMPGIENWYIVGHQKGGEEASKASIKQKNIKGAILLGSYSNSENLKLLSKKALLIWGSEDGIMNFESFVNSQKKLPTDTVYYEIIGGNTSNFGDYGLQEGDKKALISREKQQEITVKKIDEFINKTLDNNILIKGD